jgi:hypothetical protein
LKASRLEWYFRRLRRMSVAEVAGRSRDYATRWAWKRYQVLPGAWVPSPPSGIRTFSVSLPQGTAARVPPAARRAVLDAAGRVLEGHGVVLGVERHDLASPDWFLDPLTGRRAPQDRYCFRIDHRSEEQTGNVKQVWELSRHHHLTLLASAWFLSGDDRYAEMVDRQLRSWWDENPFLSGVHWTSGIELGIRLISWTWIRRLLDGWPGAPALFELNDRAAQQIHWHQRYLAAFVSGGSSANNHVIAEAAGQLVASCAFPWFPESDRWRARAATVLERELERNTFPSGLNREMAFEYLGLVAELGLVASVEAEAFGSPLGGATTSRLCTMVDAVAAVVDERTEAPRAGDGDDGRALLLDPAKANRWASVLAAGGRLYQRLPWWPPTQDDVRSVALGALATGLSSPGSRPARRSSHFADAGLTILRTPAGETPELWCSCDGGPHGFLSIAAHAHADALSIEVRHAGIPVLVDPGTYCYHGEPEWRTYFRSTRAHNTLELDGHDQSVAGGPFLWVEHASTQVIEAVVDTDGGNGSWTAEHDGYRRLASPAVHRRTVRLDRGHRRLEIVDRVESQGEHQWRLSFLLGPSVRATLDGCRAMLEWPGPDGEVSATLELPGRLLWTAHRGEVEPVIGWYSPRFGEKLPTTALVGTGTCGSEEVVTGLQFRA